MNDEQNPELDYIFHIEHPSSRYSICGVDKYTSIRTFLSLEDAFLERMREGRLVCCEECAKVLNNVITSD